MCLFCPNPRASGQDPLRVWSPSRPCLFSLPVLPFDGLFNVLAVRFCALRLFLGSQVNEFILKPLWRFIEPENLTRLELDRPRALDDPIRDRFQFPLAHCGLSVVEPDVSAVHLDHSRGLVLPHESHGYFMVTRHACCQEP